MNNMNVDREIEGGPEWSVVNVTNSTADIMILK